MNLTQVLLLMKDLEPFCQDELNGIIKDLGFSKDGAELKIGLTQNSFSCTGIVRSCLENIKDHRYKIIVQWIFTAYEEFRRDVRLQPKERAKPKTQNSSAYKLGTK
ncbi:hypothetical protein HNY73_004678 [Argiope bruennichi]|uniref:Uncharacterized protein n=1 Tax=Argiope bruennichi TaxID=94029 RepID=A0A8T0FSJ4_ARGBR|nr:hypothetical protein HNY73_004678 [Argiope bruennichi]